VTLALFLNCGMLWRMNKPPVQVDFTPLFIRFLKHVAKKYRSVRDDLQPLIDDLANGETPGDQIQHVKRTAYKVRIPTLMLKRAKVAVIVSFITSKPVLALYCWQFIPSLTKRIFRLMKSCG
jgi:hypothetical protein